MKGNESQGGPALRGSICHCGCVIPLRCWQRMKDWWKQGRVVVAESWGPSGVMRLMRGPPVPPIGYQIAYCLANSNSSTFTTVEMGAMVRQFMATELDPESAYIFRRMIKMRQGWGSP